MPDGTTPVVVPATTEGEQGKQTPIETPSPDAAPQATTPSWHDELDRVDAKELRKHPKLAGIIGSETQRAIALEKQRIQEEEGQRAAKAVEERLRQLAEEDPVSFAEQWLSEAQKSDLRRQLDDLKGHTRREFAESLGRAYAGVPEWAELTQTDHDALASALAGKSEDEVLGLFTQKALDLVAERRAQKLHAQWKEKQLPKEREAIRQEEAAKLLRTSEAPDTARPKATPGGPDIAGMSDAEFREHARKFGLRL